MGRLVAVALAAAAVASGTGAALGKPADPGYRANLVSCIMGSRACAPARLSKADRDYLRDDPTSHTRDRELAGEIADARMAPPVRVAVSERTLDRMHARDIRFEAYRSQVRALRQGWIPGANYPYQQPPRGWADAYENWGGR